MNWKICQQSYELDHPWIMGILNVTPDSFSDGGQFEDPEVAVAHGLEMVEAGAKIIDIGGESTRPGAPAVSSSDEIHRVIPIIEALRPQTDALISIDTRKAEVAERACASGAQIINDVSGGLADPEMLPLAARLGSGLILMHMQGVPETMQQNPQYGDVITEILDYFKDRLAAAKSAGVDPDCICIDPGIGFGKTVGHNLQILSDLERFTDMGRPILVGASRKSLIGAVSGAGVSERLPGSLAIGLAAVGRGANILRVHDVFATRQTLDIFAAIQNPQDYISA